MGAIRGLHHAQITIPPGAEGEARAFYCGVLGLADGAWKHMASANGNGPA